MKKILFLTNDYRGGIETFLNQIRGLSNNDFELFFAFYKKDLFGKYEKSDIFLNNIHSTKIGFSIFKIILLINNLTRTFKLINKIKPDVIVAFPNYTLVIVGLIRLFFNIKTVLIFNNDIESTIQEKPLIYGKLIKVLIRVLIKRYNKIVFISQEMLKFYSTKYNLSYTQTSLIEHSVNLEKVRKLANERLLGSDKKEFNAQFKIFSIGRFDAQKDFFNIISAFKIVSRKYRSTKLYIVGDGSQQNKILSFIRDLELKDKVVLLGWKKNVYKFLKEADVFVFSSKYEGFAMVIVEAMALGIPVISTDTPFGPREILEGGKFGVLVPMKDSKIMAEAIIKMNRSKKLRDKYSRLGDLRVKKYNTRIMLKKYEFLFLNL